MRFLQGFNTQPFWLQLGTFAGLLALGIISHYLLKIFTRKSRARLKKRSRFFYGLEETLRSTFFAVITLIGGYIAFEVFKAYSWPRDLLLKLTQLMWIVFGFALIYTGVKYTTKPGTARRATRFILLPVVALLLVLHSLNLLVPLMEMSKQQSIGLGKFQISLYGAIIGSTIIFGLYRLSVWVQSILENRFLPKALGDQGASHLASRLIAYTLLGLGVFVVLDSVGVDLTTLQILAGALGVGLGFGLQRLFLDFFAGLILMGERSLAPGNIVEIDGQLGTVKKMGFRSFVVETLDHISFVVPNSSLVDGKLINYTHTGNLVRITIPVSVSYSSEPKEVEAALLEAGASLEEGLKSVKPKVFFNAFGESSLDFTLAVWVRLENARQIPRLRSQLHYLVFDSLRAHNIEIPFPQLDLHIRDKNAPNPDNLG